MKELFSLIFLKGEKRKQNLLLQLSILSSLPKDLIFSHRLDEVFLFSWHTTPWRIFNCCKFLNIKVFYYEINFFFVFSWKEGKIIKKSSGFSGKGFKFDETEQALANERKKLQKAALGLQDSDDEDAAVDVSVVLNLVPPVETVVPFKQALNWWSYDTLVEIASEPWFVLCSAFSCVSISVHVLVVS